MLNNYEFTQRSTKCMVEDNILQDSILTNHTLTRVVIVNS